MKMTDLTRQARKYLPLGYCGAVIVAAGSASRMGGIDKVMAPLGGEPMIVRAVVAGGGSRQESVKLGLNTLSEKVKLAAVQDGARPLVTWQLIDRVVRAAHSYGAAAPAIPVKDTIKEAVGGVVKKTPDRSTLFAVQTPQVFDFDLLRAAIKKVEQDEVQVTDDCSAVEYLGMTVKLVEGDERNLKVTTPLDLKIAEMLLEEEK